MVGIAMDWREELTGLVPRKRGNRVDGRDGDCLSIE